MARRTPERKLKDAVQEYLTSVGAWCFLKMQTGYGRSGIPDFIICYRGRFIGSETKVHPRKPTVPQQREIEAIRAAGGMAFVAWKLDDIKEAIRSVDEDLALEEQALRAYGILQALQQPIK